MLVIQNYPDSPQARAADRALRTLPPAAVAAASLPATTRPFESATTQPTRGPVLRSVPTPGRVPAAEPERP